ncbi:MAG: RNA polymerase sigma factor, partial [Spirosomataceae bacterium]
AQRKLYELYASKLFAVTMRYMKNRADAEDVLQEAWVKVFKNLESFRFDCPLEAWIRRITINTAIRALKNRPDWSLHIDTEGLQVEGGLGESGLEQLTWRELVSFIQALPDGCRMVFNLYAVEGYKHHEIATLLGITEGTSKSQYFRAKALLQEKVNKSAVE